MSSSAKSRGGLDAKWRSARAGSDQHFYRDILTGSGTSGAHLE